MQLWILFGIGLLVSSVGWKKFVWLISLGYGFSMAVIGAALIAMFAGQLGPASLAICVMLVVYGLRLGIYLVVREKKSAAYNQVMKTQVNDGSGMPVPQKP